MELTCVPSKNINVHQILLLLKVLWQEDILVSIKNR